MSSAGVRTNDSSITYSTAGGSMTIRNVATARSAKVWTKPRIRGGMRPRNSVSLRCSFRSIAMADPSMASQRNENDATSSIQTTGSEKT
jgi:hypothetical protein